MKAITLGAQALSTRTPRTSRIRLPTLLSVGASIALLGCTPGEVARVDDLSGVACEDLTTLSDSSVNILVRPWCQRTDYWALKCDLTRTFKEELEAAGCSIPYPQRDVHLNGAATAA